MAPITQDRPNRRAAAAIIASVALVFGGLVAFAALSTSAAPQEDGHAGGPVTAEAPPPTEPAARPAPPAIEALAPSPVDAAPRADAEARPAVAAAPAPAPRSGAAEATGATAPAATQEAARTTPPRPAAPAAPAARVAPAERAARPAPPSPAASGVRILEAAIATGVEDRMPTGVADVFDLDAGRQLTAWIRADNPGPPTHVTMVWRRGEEVAFEIELRVGQSDGWRTWSRKTIRAWDAGEWFVEVRDKGGALLETLRFEIREGVEAEAG